MTANLPTDAIERELADAEHCVMNHTANVYPARVERLTEAKSQLRALKDAALVARVLCSDSLLTLRRSLPPQASFPDQAFTPKGWIGTWRMDQFSPICEFPIVSGLPVLTDEARRALGET